MNQCKMIYSGQKTYIKESVQRQLISYRSCFKAQTLLKKEHREAKIKVKHARAALKESSRKALIKMLTVKRLYDDLEKALAEKKATKKIKKESQKD
ncbi:hypothetical protein OQG81_03505 [Streptococcus macedonicus]|uniref:Uncharacterized protein n=1 Tax=Streptococcus macedonicus TaxID=59310 RepID=A0AA47FDK2_STRMC|nr:hypothetical protein [Streptococcus macedonicus]WAK63928.1 hypothetical protein OQG81_03505 [Streptococcus macedonicus]